MELVQAEMQTHVKKQSDCVLSREMKDVYQFVGSIPTFVTVKERTSALFPLLGQRAHSERSRRLRRNNARERHHATVDCDIGRCSTRQRRRRLEARFAAHPQSKIPVEWLDELSEEPNRVGRLKEAMRARYHL